MDQIKKIKINGKEYSIDGDNAFIRYSENADGTDFTENWHKGQNYIGFASSQEAPTDKSGYTWVMLPKGTKGDKGDKGDSPKAGVDYFTEAEKAEFAKEVETACLGDIETALDSIIALQNSLMGGESV